MGVLLNCYDTTRRWTLALLRQPWFVAITLIQPMIWLLLFGALFSSVVDIPGFAGDNYKTFLAPGIVVMNALFSAGWNGMGMINDLEKGVMDRFLVTPVSRAPLIVGGIAQSALSIVIQSLVVVAVALATGATFPGGPLGVLAMIATAVLLAAAVAGLSQAVALTARKEETLIGFVQFMALPLTFLSGAFMQLSLAPHWIETVARYNPVNWAVGAAREAVAAHPDWGYVLARMGLLLALAAACLWLAVRAFRAYQRSA